MKTSVIRQRVADFLKHHAPFDALSQQDLLDLAGSGKVKFHESEEYLYRQGDSKSPFVWAIQQGRVEILEEAETGERLRDVLGEGDLLGLERFVGDGSCLHSARTATDVILYGVSASLFEAAHARYPGVRRFVSAHSTVSGHLGFTRSSWLESDPPPADFLRARRCAVRPESTAAEMAAALQASPNGVAAIVDEENRPLGVVTALGLLTGRDEERRQCPPAVQAPVTIRAAVRTMLSARTAQIAITGDGTPAGRLEAILTGTEVALFCGHDPVRLAEDLLRATTVEELAPLWRRAMRMVSEALAQPHDVDDCCRIRATLLNSLARACVGIATNAAHAAGLPTPAVPHCWVLFGESGRGDVLGADFPAVAVIYDDADAASRPQDCAYFAAVAGTAAERLHAVGLTGVAVDWPPGTCPSMPLSEWKRVYSETIRHPLGLDLYSRRAFFDIALLSGESSLVAQLEDFILRELREHEVAVPLWANDTLAHVPPLTFFRGLVVDLDGEQRDSFDIVHAVVSPIASAARVFAVAKQRLSPANTLCRLEAALGDYPEGAEQLRQAADAFRVGLYYQAVAGDALIDPSRLGKFDRLLLKTAFSSIQRFLEFTVSKFLPDEV